MVLALKKPVKGVKGPSVTSLLDNLSIINSFPPDYLHSCLEGVSKLFITAWFCSSHKDEIWYLGNKTTQFDKNILSIHPPCEITRVPHSIVKNKYKASEWKNITIYYSLPSLKKLMLPRYYKHWFLYVYSMYIFLKDNITPEEYDSASKALQLFIDDIETLYGSDFMKFNVHLLKHIKDFVRQFGALWA